MVSPRVLGVYTPVVFMVENLPMNQSNFIYFILLGLLASLNPFLASWQEKSFAFILTFFFLQSVHLVRLIARFLQKKA